MRSSTSTPLVINVQKFSVHDGHGIRTSIFFKGCLLKCWWCHNPESQAFYREPMFDAGKCTGCGFCLQACSKGAIRISPETGKAVTDHAKCITCGACVDYCPQEAREIVGRTYTVDELVELARADQPFYEKSGGGVTLSGGECMMQNRDFIEELCQRLHFEGISIDIDTCGFAPLENYRRLLPYVDMWLYDIKTLDEEKHRKYIGRPNGEILRNLEFLAKNGAPINIRIPVVNSVNDDDKSIQDIIDYLLEHVGMTPVNLLPYHTTGSSKYSKLGRPYLARDLEVPSPERMDHLKDLFVQAGYSDVSIGG